MESFFFAVLAIGFGLIACFAGYQFFRTLLPILAGLYGYTVALSWFGPNQWLAALVVGIGLMILFALMAYAFWSITVGLGGAMLGYGIGSQLALFIGFGGFFAFLSGMIVAVIFGAMFFTMRDLLVMVSTALSGAGLILTGLAMLLPTLLGWLANESNFITFLLTIVLAFVGFGAQYRTIAKRNMYGSMQI